MALTWNRESVIPNVCSGLLTHALNCLPGSIKWAVLCSARSGSMGEVVYKSVGDAGDSLSTEYENILQTLFEVGYFFFLPQKTIP